MASAKSKLLVSVGVLAAVAVVAVVIVSKTLDSAVTKGVNTFAPQITGTTVTLESASISPLSGSGSLSGLVIGNPEGWSDNNLASLGHIHLDVAPMSLLGDTIVIEDMVIEAPEFRYETKLVASNVKDLLKNIEKIAGAGSEDEAQEDSPEQRIAIKRFILRNGKVSIGAGDAAVTVPLPDLELNDLGSPDNGLTPTQLSVAVSKEIVGDIIGAAVKGLTTMGGTSGASALEGVKDVGGAIKGLFGGNKDKDEPKN
ncbi:AsmA family protein [Opitutaceae bacterium]|nr:AsmA family protein [Opitutaceae bacterium]